MRDSFAIVSKLVPLCKEASNDDLSETASYNYHIKALGPIHFKPVVDLDELRSRRLREDLSAIYHIFWSDECLQCLSKITQTGANKSLQEISQQMRTRFFDLVPVLKSRFRAMGSHSNCEEFLYCLFMTSTRNLLEDVSSYFLDVNEGNLHYTV